MLKSWYELCKDNGVRTPFAFMDKTDLEVETDKR